MCFCFFGDKSAWGWKHLQASIFRIHSTELLFLNSWFLAFVKMPPGSGEGSCVLLWAFCQLACCFQIPAFPGACRTGGNLVKREWASYLPSTGSLPWGPQSQISHMGAVGQNTCASYCCFPEAVRREKWFEFGFCTSDAVTSAVSDADDRHLPDCSVGVCLGCIRLVAPSGHHPVSRFPASLSRESDFDLDW